MGKPTVFLCYATSEQDVMDDFVDRFMQYNSDLFEIFYDRDYHNGPPDDRFEHFARDCDIAVLMCNSRYLQSDSYASKYELPILMERYQKGEVKLVGILMSTVDIRNWNKEKQVYFLQVRNNQLRHTRLDDQYGSEFNRGAVVYDLIKTSGDRNAYHSRLQEWLLNIVTSQKPTIASRKHVESLPVSQKKLHTHESTQKNLASHSVNIFISYANNKEDQKILAEIKKYLSQHKKKWGLNLWDDGCITPGTIWDDTIKEHLSNADLILLLISVDFNNSDYISQTELPIAFEKKTEGVCEIIPIYIRECDYKDREYSKFGMIPKIDGKGLVPVKSSYWKPRDQAYMTVVNQLKIVIENIYTKKILENQPKLRSHDFTKVILSKMTQGTLFYSIEEKLSTDLSFWERANIDPLEDPEDSIQIYTWYFIEQLISQFSMIRNEISLYSVNDFSQKREILSEKIMTKNRILRDLIEDSNEVNISIGLKKINYDFANISEKLISSESPFLTLKNFKTELCNNIYTIEQGLIDWSSHYININEDDLTNE